MSFRTPILSMMLCFSFLIIIPIHAQNAQSFDIETLLEEDEFYTMPLLSGRELSYNYTSTENGSLRDSSVEVDIIDGEAEGYWEDLDFPYRTPFEIDDSQEHPYVSYLEFPVGDMIDDSLMLDDCSDMVFNDGEGNRIKSMVYRCDDDAIVRLALEDEESMKMYHGGLSVDESLQEVSSFYEPMHNITEFNNSWDYHGNISVDEGHLISDNLNHSSANLTAYDIKDDFEILMDLFVTGDSEMTLYLSEDDDLYESSYSVTFKGDQDEIEACLNDAGESDCSRYGNDVGENWNEFRIDGKGDGLWLYFNDERLNSIEQYYNLEGTSLYLSFEGLTFIDYISVIDSGESSFTMSDTETHIDRVEGEALQGDYGFTYNVDGFESGIYSVATRGTHPDRSPQYDTIYFEVYNNKIEFELNEEGITSSISGNHLIDTEGTLTVTNDNDETVPVEIPFPGELIIHDDSGERISDSGVSFELDPFSSESIDFFVTGALSGSPIDTNMGPVAVLIRDNLDDDVHEIISTRFSKEEVEFEEVPAETDFEEEELRKELRYEVEDGFIIDSFTRINLVKSVSQEIVRPGDIVDVELRVTNLDPFSREVELRDSLPEEFSIHEGNDELKWEFGMNKHTSRVFSYSMLYEGSSTGRVNVPLGNITSEGLLIFSNNETLLRDGSSGPRLHYTKRYRSINATSSQTDSPAEVVITLTNLGEERIEDILVDDSNVDMGAFFSSSVRTPHNARWEIDGIYPQETWQVSYMTEQGDYLADDPDIEVLSNDVMVSGDTKKMEKDPVSLPIESRFTFPFLGILILVAIIDLGIMYKYVEKNPFFDPEETITPRLVIIKAYEKLPDAYRNIVSSIYTKIYVIYHLIWRFSHTVMEKTQSSLSNLKKRSKRYYEERNISLVHERSSHAIHSSLEKIEGELVRLKGMSLKDWMNLFIRYKREFFRSVKNRITYSMFVLSGKLLTRNDNSKLGQILGFSAKVLNPELKGYLASIASKKMEKRQKAYQKEISNIESLMEMTRKVKSSEVSFKDRIKMSFKRITEKLNFFKR